MIWNPARWLLAFTLVAAVPLHAADVNITINGQVVALPCTVTTTNALVEISDIYTFDMATAGSSSIWYDTALELTNCPDGTSRVTATFSGTADATGYYKNQGSAGNIQLELQDDQGSTLNTGAKKTVDVDTTTQSARFPLKVRALTVNGGATQGSIQAVINVTYTYA